MALLERKPKAISEARDQELRKLVQAGEAAAKELRETDGAKAIRSGQASEILARTTIAIKDGRDARHELERRRSDLSFRDGVLRRSDPFYGVRAFVHPELLGATLDKARLDAEETRELRSLAKRRRELGDDFSETDEERYEHLVGMAAGDPSLFETKRRESEMRAKIASAASALHVSTLPRRPKLEEPGSVTLPRFVFQWLSDGRLDTWSLSDTAALIAVLFAFENDDARLFARATFEHEEGAATIVISDAAARLNLGAGVDPDGTIPLRQCLETLERNKWIELRRDGGTLRIRLGERARKLREGWTRT